MSKIALIDGNSLMFRSYYATAYTGNLMKTKSGIYTNALFGFCNMFTKVLEDEYEYIFVAFDAGKKTFRHQEYTEYKGGRKPLPDELRMQIPIIKDYLDTLPIKHFETLEFEADDLIASMSKKLDDGQNEIYVITGDKDLLQLVSSNINVCLTKKGINELDMYTLDNFKEKMGFMPLQILDYKGLVGDSSDNLPGIKGVGEKTAIKLINEFGSLEGIYENIDKLSGKTKDLFVNGEETSRKCKYLATLRKDANVPFEKEDIKKNEINYTGLKEFYQKYEFSSLLKRLEKVSIDTKKDIDITDIKLTKVFTKEDFGDGFISCEVFKANYFNGEFLGLGVHIDGKNFFFSKEDITKNIYIKEYLEDERYKKYTFDLKLLYFVLDRDGISLKGACFDLLLAMYIINPNYASDDFKQTISHMYDSKIPFYDTIYGANSKMAIPSSDVYINYALSKALFIKECHLDIEKEIDDIDCKYLFEMEMKLSKVLFKMERDGLLIDTKKLDELEVDFLEKENEISKRIYEISECEFNINSPKQLGEVLFEKLHLPHGKKNKTGYSTNSEVLEGLKNDFEIARLVLEYRAYNKLLTTYVIGLKEVMDENSFIHPLYKQALTQTGRLSSVEPNIQNMPIRTELGQVIREAFISRFSDGAIMTSDYSQVELRVLANMSKDKVMVDSFNSGVDFHKKTASQLFDVDVNDVTKDMRRTAKAINFGIIYGMSAWGLSEQIGITPLEANMFINKYFDTFKGAKETLDNFINEAKGSGYSKTMFNRRRYIPELASSNQNLYQFGERTAMNSPIQGSAADIIKIAMVQINDKLEEEGFKSKMIAQVHDELVFDVLLSEKEKLEKMVKETMEGVINQSVKLIAEIEIGMNWFLAK